MAIQSVGEFSIIMNNIVAGMYRLMDQQPGNTKLVTVKRQMEAAAEWAQTKHKPSAKELLDFEAATDTIRQHHPGDDDLSNRLFDLLDFLEYRL